MNWFMKIGGMDFSKATKVDVSGESWLVLYNGDMYIMARASRLKNPANQTDHLLARFVWRVRRFVWQCWPYILGYLLGRITIDGIRAILTYLIK